MKTFSELREEIDAVLAKRQIMDDYGKSLSNEVKESLRFLNLQINGVNSIPSRDTIKEFSMVDKGDQVFVRGGYASFGTMFSEETEYPEGITYADIRHALELEGTGVGSPSDLESRGDG